MATKHKYKHPWKKDWTYGAELELADWPRNEPLPKGMQVDDGAYTNVNSNGVAADGPGKYYHLGGEILTAPSVRVEGPAEQFKKIIELWPETSLNYRMGLNVHVRVPGLRESLRKLKQVQKFIHQVMPYCLRIIDPIPIVTRERFGNDYKMARRCYTTRRRDHYTLMKGERLKLQLSTQTVDDFFNAEALHVETGKVHWAIVPRVCVNLRQLLQTDTVEFRHWFMPESPRELHNCTLWCKEFMLAALDGGNVSAQNLLENINFERRTWPVAMEYNSWLDRGWYATSRHKVDKLKIASHIEDWLRKNPEPRGEVICLGR